MAHKHFDAVIIGSGFGGAVATYRLAQAGLRVCLVERGKAYPPHSFSRSPYDLSKNFWDPSSGLFGLFDIWSFKGSGALVSSGLGGGSLIYANVLIRKDEKWFIKEDVNGGSYERWPIEYSDLERHYESVERMMNVQKYPFAHAPYDHTLKALAFREAAGKLHFDDTSTHKWLPLNLAVSFRRNRVGHPDDDDPANVPVMGGEINDPLPNYHSVINGRGMPRSTCRLCGECDLGCNYGSKNTLDYTYITAAIHERPYPAQVETLAEVKSIAPLDGKGYSVEFVRHEPDRVDPITGRRPAPSNHKITSTVLILSAGTFGTPYLLLKNQAAFPALNRSTLGSRYCVNGDLLSFVVKSMEQKNGKTVPRRLDPSFGPVITSAIRVGDTLDGLGRQGRGFYTEDGAHPYLMSWFSELSGFPGLVRRSVKLLKMMAKYRFGLSNDANLSAEISELLGPATGSMSSFPILTMGRDIPNGRLSLKDGLLECDWNISKSQEYFDRVRRVGKAIAQALQAEYLDNPSYRWNFHQVLTAHPLGGAPMASAKELGVVDSYGQVFDYPGLYILDGSAMPGPVGPNPSLTIAAFADRCAERIGQEFRRP